MPPPTRRKLKKTRKPRAAATRAQKKFKPEDSSEYEVSEEEEESSSAESEQLWDEEDENQEDKSDDDEEESDFSDGDTKRRPKAAARKAYKASRLKKQKLQRTLSTNGKRKSPLTQQREAARRLLNAKKNKPNGKVTVNRSVVEESSDEEENEAGGEFERGGKATTIKDTTTSHIRPGGRSMREIDPTVSSDPTSLDAEILDWDIRSDLEKERKAGGKGSGGSTVKVPDKFTSYQHYVSVWKPLTLQEIFAQSINSISSDGSPTAVQIRTRQGSSNLSQFAQIRISVLDEKRGGTPIANVPTYIIHDLVLLTNDKEYLTFEEGYEPGNAALALVTSQTKSREGLQVKALTKRWRRVASGPDDTIYMFRINNLITSMREFSALCRCRDYPLMPLLLSGEHKKGSLELDTLGHHYVQWLESHFNESQQEAIKAAATSSGFTLIKGPPGTGKTTTLKGLLNSLHLREYNRYYNAVLDVAQRPDRETAVRWAKVGNEKPHILVTAPSNIAVDNIINKIMSEGFCDGQGRQYFPSIVRVGRGRSEAMRPVSLDHFVDDLLKKPLEVIEKRLWELRARQKQIEMDSLVIRAEFRKTVEWIKDEASPSSPPPPDTPDQQMDSSSPVPPPPAPAGSPPMAFGTPQPPAPDTPDSTHGGYGLSTPLPPPESPAMYPGAHPVSTPDVSYSPTIDTSSIGVSYSADDDSNHPEVSYSPLPSLPPAMPTSDVENSPSKKGLPPPMYEEDDGLPPPLPPMTDGADGLPPPLPPPPEEDENENEPVPAPPAEPPIEEDVKPAAPNYDAFPGYRNLAQKMNGCLEELTKVKENIVRHELVRRMRLENGREMYETKAQLEISFLDTAHIVFTTLSSAGLQSLDSSSDYDVLVVDEAAQAVELSNLIPMRFQSKQCVLVGDPQQLPATVFSRSSAQSLYERSLFERLEACNHPVHMLRVQYRSHPTISKFPREFFYDGKLEDGPNVLEKSYQRPYHELSSVFQPLVFFNLLNSAEAQDSRAVSRRNVSEAELAVNLYLTLKNACPPGSIAGQVGVITPYSQQQSELRRTFRRTLGDNYEQEVEINTVDGFQGREKDIIILSTVRADPTKNIGFLSDVRRMNVALTRAKYACYIVGSEATLVSSPPWKRFLDHVWDTKCLVHVEDPSENLLKLERATIRSTSAKKKSRSRSKSPPNRKKPRRSSPDRSTDKSRSSSRPKR